MAHYESRMSSKGQLTVPAAVREVLNLKEGDRVDFYVDDRGGALRVIARNRKLRDMVGLLHRPGQEALGAREANDAVGAFLEEKHDRIGREWSEWQEFQAWKAKKAAE